MGENFLPHIPFLPASSSSVPHHSRTDFYFHLQRRVTSSRGLPEWCGLEAIRHVSSSCMPGHTCWWGEAIAPPGCTEPARLRLEPASRCNEGAGSQRDEPTSHVEVPSERQAGAGGGTGASRALAPPARESVGADRKLQERFIW